MKRLLLFLWVVFMAHVGLAQDQLLQVARQYLLSQDYTKAAATFKQLLDYNSGNPEILQGYTNSLLGMGDFAGAEKMLKQQLKKNSTDLRTQYDLARVWQRLKEDKKADKQFQKLNEQVLNREDQLRTLARWYEKDGMALEAITLYEKGRNADKLQPYRFAEELAVLYDAQGKTELAMESLLDMYVSTSDKQENVKAAFQRMMTTPDKLDILRKKIIKRSAKDAEQLAWPDLLAWYYTQQGDYESAFQQIRAIDTRLHEDGRRMLGFGRLALREKQYNAALQAYRTVAELGTDKPFYQLALSEELTVLNRQLRAKPTFTAMAVDSVIKKYDDFIQQFPAFQYTETSRDLAELEARMGRKPEKAIERLTRIVQAPQTDRIFRGQCKLDMGDYELLRNNRWESTLLYSQVDKEFKQDMLGEEARFRNARLSYYTGDFVWAQGQLDVLKASTSELIANDALNLSVLITENNPPADSNSTPLLLFAQAELLAFQYRDAECLALLDTISISFPQHVLADDILMVKANMAIRQQDYNEAAKHFQRIIDQYADDVLADDALFQLAVIYQEQFNNTDEAKRLFEKLMVDFPGSSFVNESRKRYRTLRGDKVDPDFKTF
jgi:tetratricopeptide (TPR) repeat protein